MLHIGNVQAFYPGDHERWLSKKRGADTVILRSFGAAVKGIF